MANQSFKKILHTNLLSGMFNTADMRKDQKCPQNRIDDNKMSTFSHVLWITL